ncbi:MAG: hypothetical protein CXX81_21805 [Methanobacteriota archaeon]|nr:MAG: hypothetical protein CXX81_29730 [Euryarchaeota archaeon]PXY74232.1 MAG: hypothetical protein CXX81_21805 [Euryarchaeota archaeon]
MSGDVIPFGQFKLYDRVIPPLYQGEYRVKMSQTLPSGIPSASLSADRYFNITGPRWHLDPTAVHSMTPPDKEQDAITSAYLPMVVLQRRTLPWERDLFGGSGRSVLVGSANQYPSMALLLFTEDEISFKKGTDNEYVGIFKGSEGLAIARETDSSVSGKSTEMGVFPQIPAAAAHSDAGDLSHDWAENNIGNDNLLRDRIVDVVKVPFDTLKAVCPTLPEIRLLAHAREVNPMDKEQCGSDEDGWFSVVLGNRLPTKTDTKYHACLVSLEGRLDEGWIQDEISESEFNDEVPMIIGGIGSSAPITDYSEYKSSSSIPKTSPSDGGPGPKSGGLGKKKKKWFPKVSKKHMNLMNILMAGGATGHKSNGASLSVTSPPVKLVLLHHWTFKTTESGGDYESRMKSLHLRIKEPGNSEWEEGELVKKSELIECKANKALAEPMLLGNDMVRDVARNGYLTTEMVHSDGGTSDVVYRGPLTPLPVSHKWGEKDVNGDPIVYDDGKTWKDDGPYFNSDQALAYAADVGMLQDISHASAFEIGRLLAFSDHSFVKAAARWRQTIYVGKKVTETYTNLQIKYSDLSQFSGNQLKIGPMSVGNLSQSILKTTTQCLSQSTANLQKMSVQVTNTLPLDLPGTGVTDPPPQEYSYSAEAKQIADTFSNVSSSMTGELDSLKKGYQSTTGQGEPE